MKRLFLAIIPFVLLSVNSAQSGAQAGLPTIGAAAGRANIVIGGEHTSKEVFTHFSSECAGGKLLFLASMKTGRFVRLTLLEGLEAASYIDTDGDGKYPWLLACEGASRFLVEKEHRYSPGGLAFRLYKGRALEGIDYAVRRSTMTQTASTAKGMDEEAFLEKMASGLAAFKMDFVSTNQGTRFSGRYEHAAGGCDTVSVSRLEVDGASRRYRVCSGKAYPLAGPAAPMVAAAE